MRDNHARRGAREGVQAEGDVEEPERDNPQHPRRDCLPRADHPRAHSAARARVDEAHRDWQARIRRPGASPVVVLGVRCLSVDGLRGLQYRASDFLAPGPGKLELVYSPADGGAPTKINVYDFKSPGVALAMYNTDEVSVGTRSEGVFVFDVDRMVAARRSWVQTTVSTRSGGQVSLL